MAIVNHEFPGKAPEQPNSGAYESQPEQWELGFKKWDQ